MNKHERQPIFVALYQYRFNRTMEKAFKDCKWVPHPTIMHKHKNVRFMLNSIKTYVNPNALDIIEANWDWIVEHHPGYLNVLTNNTNPNAIKLIDRNWDWFIRQKNIPMQILYKNPNVEWLIEKHWDWFVVYNKDHWRSIMNNPMLVNLIDRHWDWFNLHINKDHLFSKMCHTKHTISLIEKHYDDNTLTMLNNNLNSICKNPAAIPLIKKHWTGLQMNKYNWGNLCGNPMAIDIIDDHFEEIKQLFIDQPDIAIHYARQQLFQNLFSNKAAIPLIEKHWTWLINNVMSEDFTSLCQNPNAVPLIKANWNWLMEKNVINWFWLCSNPNAATLIEQHWDRIISGRSLSCPGLLQHTIYNDIADIVDRHFDTINTHIGTNTYIWSFLYSSRLIDKYWDRIYSISSGMSTSRQQEIIGIIKYAYEHIPSGELFNIIEKRWPTISTIFSTANIKHFYSINEMFVDEYRGVATKWFRSAITEELMATVWHPRNIARFPSLGVDPDA